MGSLFRVRDFQRLGIMTSLEPSPRDSSTPTLADRVPGQAVMNEALSIHSNEPERSWLRRFLGAGPLSERSRPWFQGALGEIAVGKILDGLGPEWTVLHAVPVGAGTSDIDHVLVGPAGAFTLNTKHHSGQRVWVGRHTVLVAGQKQHHLSHARHEANRAEKLLTAAMGEPVPVIPVVVLVAPKKLTIKEKPSGVVVLTDSTLRRWLQRRRPVLPEDHVVRVAAAAALPGTWHQNPPPPEADPAALQERFAALRASVTSARRRQQLWFLGIRVGAVMALIAYGPELLGALVTVVLS